MIESRRFLNWTGAWFALVCLLGITVTTGVLPPDIAEFLRSPALRIVWIASAVLALAVTVDAMRHITESRNFAWLWAIVLLAFGGAYLYGFLVASKTSPH